MLGNHGLKKAVVGIGLSIVVLIAVFNAHAPAENEAPALPAKTYALPLPSSREDLTETLSLTLMQMNKFCANLSRCRNCIELSLTADKRHHPP